MRKLIMKITLEAYSKEYKNLLIDTNAPYALPSEFDIDKYYYPSSLTSDGKGYARGIELLVHKKLVKQALSYIWISGTSLILKITNIIGGTPGLEMWYREMSKCR